MEMPACLLNQQEINVIVFSIFAFHIETNTLQMVLSIILGFLGGLGTGEIILIALVVLLLFGGRKIPELMRGIGKGVKSFKDGMAGLEEEMKQPPKEDKTPDQEKKNPPEKAG
jgi:sec-independent protein translocase protein TatA